MTELLKKAVSKVEELSSAEQDAIAAVILAEIEDEARWDAKFKASQDALAKLSEEALAEHRAGLTTELHPNKL